jgi:hypothetical protein
MASHSSLLTKISQKCRFELVIDISFGGESRMDMRRKRSENKTVTNKIFLIFGFLCALAFFLPFQSSAVMKGLSTEELTRESKIIVSGEVENVESHWSRDGKTIVTRASIFIDDVVRGRTTTRNIIVEYEGGEIGDIGLMVSDVSPLMKGEKVILFLKSGKSKKDGADVYNIVGKGQGKYTIDDKGIARKGGFSLAYGEENVDNNIPVGVLIDKIRKMK